MNKTEIRAANRARNTAIHDAAAGTPELLQADNIGLVINVLPAVIANALTVIADGFRARAEAYAGKPRGKSTSDKLKYAETELRGIVVSLLADGIDEEADAGTPIAVMSPPPGPTMSAAVTVTTTVCGLTDGFTTPAAGREPDTCLLNASHLDDGSNHQGKYSRWPARDDDKARWAEANAVHLDAAQAFATDVELTPETVERIAALPEGSMVVEISSSLSPTDLAAAQRTARAESPTYGTVPEIFGPDSYAEAMIDLPEIFGPDHAGFDDSVMRPFVLDETTALPRRGHRSVSQIETYNACGMKYRLRYRDGVSGPPAWFLVGGTIFHRAVERICWKLPDLATYEAAVAGGWAPDLEGLWKYFYDDEVSRVETSSGVKHENWRHSTQRNGTREDCDWWEANGLEMLKTYFAWHCARLRDDWEILRIDAEHLAVELEFVLDVGGVPVKGYIDTAWFSRKRGVVEIIDEKTGASTPGDSFQLGMYGHAIVDFLTRYWDDHASQLGFTAGFYNARKGELKLTKAPVLEQHPWEEIVYQTTTMDRAEREGVYLANTNTNYGGCGSCELRKACPIGARRGG